MIAYVESNFVLELAFLQEECAQAESILVLAESGRIQLVMPAFSGVEPYERMTRRSRDRKALHERLTSEIRELSRSSPYGDIKDTARELTAILAQSASEEKARLDSTIVRLATVSDVIPLERGVLLRSVEYQAQFALTPQDAIVFASIVGHMSSGETVEEKVFVTKNTKDFLNPDISELLLPYACKLLFKFSDAIGYIQSVIERSAD